MPGRIADLRQAALHEHGDAVALTLAEVERGQRRGLQPDEIVGGVLLACSEILAGQRHGQRQAADQFADASSG